MNSVVLPAPFGPDDRSYAACWDFERYIIERRKTAESPRDIIETQDAHAGFLRVMDDTSFGSEAMPPGA